MTLPYRPSAVIFDMDGLLFDTEALWQEALLSAAAEGGHEIPDEVFNKSIGVRRSQCRGLFLSHFGEDYLFEDFHGGGCAALPGCNGGRMRRRIAELCRRGVARSAAFAASRAAKGPWRLRWCGRGGIARCPPVSRLTAAIAVAAPSLAPSIATDNPVSLNSTAADVPMRAFAISRIYTSLTGTTLLRHSRCSTAPAAAGRWDLQQRSLFALP
jgi:hypothetical protein